MQKPYIGTQSIDNIVWIIYIIFITSFQLKNKFEKTQFFAYIFLLADNSIEIFLKLFFLAFVI